MHDRNQNPKVVLLGDSNVGKTSLVQAWTKNNFSEEQAPTIGAAYTRTTFEDDGHEYHVQIWDTAGEEKYRSIAPIYSQGAVGAFIVFDLTRRDSFNNVAFWISAIQNLGQIPIVLVGNKIDIEESIEVSNEEASNYAAKIKAAYFETSAKTGFGVREVFHYELKKAVKYADTLNEERESEIVRIDKSQTTSGWCC